MITNGAPSYDIEKFNQLGHTLRNISKGNLVILVFNELYFLLQ